MNKRKSVSIYLTLDQEELIREIAKKERRPMAWVLRELVLLGLKERGFKVEIE